MARGGGTGSRNKKKKSSEAPTTQNGSVENHKATPDTSGGEIKQNKSKHRKPKEETPPVIPPEEDQKESQSSKLVPTSEQLRLAQITQSAETNMDPQRKAKISQVMDITGKSEDEVATALFDCGWDETKAIELLLEEGGLGSWETTGQKKKKKADKEEPGKENDDWNEEFDPNNQFSDNRERSRNRGPPRLRNRGGSSNQGGGRDGDQWKNREFQENEKNFEGGRGRGGRGMGPRSRGGGQGGGMPPRQRGRGGGPRGFNNRGDFGERGERPERPAGEGGLGQIDTWNPIGQEHQEQRQRHHKLQNKDAFDNAGNWGDDFPTAEDWDNDEYTGSLSDTKVFTPSGSSAKAVGEPVNGTASHPAAVGAGAPLGGAPQPSAANNSLGSSYSQPIDLSTLLKPGGLAAPSAAPGGPTGHSQYNQTATQDLKTAIGIGGKSGEQLAPGYGSSSLSYSSGTGGVPSAYTSTASHQSNSFNSPAPGSAFSPIKPAAVTNGSAGGSKALPRARLPPPSKIPSSAVEMPGVGDSLSNLDVQFGGLDLQFGGSNNDSNSSNFDFNAAPGPGVSSTPPGTAKDGLDSKYVHSIQSGAKGDAPALDSYKAPGQPSLAPGSVKEVNQSLSSALSAAGIKPSSSTDSVPGYGREGPTRPDSKSNPGYGVPGSTAQRSPGPLINKTEPLGYTSPAYSYQSNNQSQPSKGGNFNSYPSNQSYERQNSSSGYSSTNGLSSSYGTASGASSSYNSGSPSNSSGYPGNSSSYSNSQSGSNFNAPGYGSATATTNNYSSYTSNNSYSSKTVTPSSTTYLPTSSASASLSQYTNSQESNISTSTSSKSSYDAATVSAPGYGAVPSTGLGLSSSMVGGQTVSSASKMSVNTTSGKMVPGMPPGVASVLPAQYMIGANAAAGFPAYLAAGLGQAPAMYGYGGHQLEDLAALQRSTLAASLPQLVGNASGQGGNNPNTAKGPSTGYYDPSSQFGGGAAGVPSTLANRQDQQSSFGGDNSKFGGAVSDSTSSPVPSSVANTGQPTPFNALASTFAAAAPQQHPTLPPGYAYFYGGVGGMPGALQAYGGGVGGGVYPATHPGIPVPTAAGATNTSQFQNKPYASSYGTSYDSLNLGQNSSGYGKNNYGNDTNQPKSGTSSSNAAAGLFQVTGTGAVPSGKLMASLGRDQRYW